jgi:hypothetical protein
MMPMEPRLNTSIIFDRLMRLVRLDTSVFSEVKDDPAATLPAVIVVIVSTILAGIGGWMWWLVKGYGNGGKVFLHSVIVGTFFSFALWVVWLFVAYVILTQVFSEDADWQQMLRTMGMASIPLALSVVMFVPGIDFGLALASVALFFGLTTLAIQAVTPADPARVLVANLAGFTIWAVVLGLLVTNSNFYAPGIFVMGAPAEILHSAGFHF